MSDGSVASSDVGIKGLFIGSKCHGQDAELDVADDNGATGGGGGSGGHEGTVKNDEGESGPPFSPVRVRAFRPHLTEAVTTTHPFFFFLSEPCPNMNSVNDIKRDLDAKLATQLNPEWIAACLTFLESTGIGGLPARPRLLNMVEDQLLVSNLEMSSLGCLPEDIPRRHGTTLRGQFLVQVQDCINVSEPSDKRYNHSSHRTLKLGLFDGKITISAMELTHIPQISMDMPAGFKVRRFCSSLPSFLAILTQM